MLVAVDGVGAAKVGDLLPEGVAGGGSGLEGGEAAALVGEEGGGFAEFEVGLVDEGLFLLELGFEGCGGFGQEVLHCCERVSDNESSDDVGWNQVAVSGKWWKRGW